MPLSKAMQALDRHLAAQNKAALDRVSKAEDWPPRWCARYRYKADHPWATTTHRSDSPQDLVRFMRDHFNGNEQVIVERVWSEGVLGDEEI